MSRRKEIGKGYVEYVIMLVGRRGDVRRVCSVVIVY